MKIIKTKFKDLVIIKKETHIDNRGYFRELYKNKILKKKFIFDVMSLSKKSVLRGLHLQLNKPQAKLITVIKGHIFDVALDCRKNSKTFGKYFSINLSENDNTSLYIPEGFAHGFLCLTKNCTINYSCSQYRDAKSELTLSWKDEKLNIKWPVKKPTLSKKDRNGLSLEEIQKFI